MSCYLHQEFDFIERTKKLIVQYEKLSISGEEKYEVTLFLNCLVGLLILPQQVWYDNLPQQIISQKEWGIAPEHIAYIKEGEKSIKYITTHLRNSVAHYRFTAFNNSSNKINRIKFEDCNRNNEKTFEATIPLDNLREYVKKLSDRMIIDMKE